MTPDYSFYTGAYLGDLIPEKQYVPCMARARVALQHFDSVYRVTGTQEERNQALCAMAEVIYRDRCRGGAVKATVGSVSVQYQADAYLQLWRELYAAARIYLKICRGVAG